MASNKKNQKPAPSVAAPKQDLLPKPSVEKKPRSGESRAKQANAKAAHKKNSKFQKKK